MSWGQFKPLLADAVIAHLDPIQVACCTCIKWETSSSLVRYLLLSAAQVHKQGGGCKLTGRCPCCVQKRYAEVTDDPTYLDAVLAQGAERATSIANVTLENAYSALGFVRPHKLVSAPAVDVQPLAKAVVV